MATINKRKDSGYFFARIKTRTGTKRVNTKIRNDEANRAKAEAWAEEYERTLRVEGPPWQLIEALNEGRLKQELDRRSPSTVDRSRVSGAHLRRVFGDDLNLNQADPVRTSEHYLMLRRAEGVTDHTISKELSFLGLCLRRGKKLKVFRGDAAEWWPESLTGYYTPRDRWLTVPEFEALLDEERKAHERYSCRIDRSDWLWGYVLTGCRYNELHTIRKKHVDLSRGRVFIDGQKTKHSKRWVPILDDLGPILERRCGAAESADAFLFAPRWPAGRMCESLHVWCKGAGIAPCSANDFRRSFVTWMFEREVPEHLVQAYVGHTNSRMIRQVYRQKTDAMNRDTINKFGRIGTGSELGSNAVPYIGKPRKLRETKAG